MKKYNVLIVDDEFLARKLLQEYVQKIDSLNIIDCCSDGIKAMDVLRKGNVDIMLLDIQMPEFTGLELLKTMTDKPAVILTTAYSEYAVDAFSYGVVDYLLKPFDFPRFLQAINKAVDVRTKVTANVEDSDGSDGFVMVRANYKLHKINFNDLIYAEGQHEYVSFYTKQKHVIALYTLKKLEGELPKGKFIRVHKSYIVAIDFIDEIDKTTITIHGKKIPVGPTFHDDIVKILSKKG